MTSKLRCARMIADSKALYSRLKAKGGNILVYVIMVMLIFAILGVTMVSLFSTSISSSATANKSRRAFYLFESGTRYAMSELRNRGFSDAIIDPINQTTFNLQPSGKFDLNVLSYWFESASDQNIPKSGSGTITLDIPKGEIPVGVWTSTPANLFLVNCNYIDRVNPRSDSNPPDSARATVAGFAIDPGIRKSLGINLVDDGTDGFLADNNTQQCFAVKPDSDQLILPFTNLRVDVAAKNIFPKSDGAIEINRRPFLYKKAIDKGSYVELTDISFASWDPLYSIPQELVKAASDYVILSPRNYVILSQGQAGDVTFGGDMANSTAIARLSPGGEAPDIGPENLDYSDTGDFQQTKSDTDFIRLNETNKSITIGGGSGDRLGSVFFRDTRNIGGVREFCNEGGCFFDQGIRVFFTLDYTGNGDGFVFALINANSNKNDKASAGGDIERSELLGYSGDSRVNVSGTLFLDNSGPTLTPGGTVVRGLIAPKIGLEFDGKVNYNSDFEKSVDYCSSTANLDDRGTRNDPGATNRDAMQYVFWGNSTLDIECRKQPYCGSSLGCKGDPSYDDNRHNATGPVIPPNWTFNTDWSVNSSPALASDGTIYIGSNSTNFYAIYANGTQKWKLDRSGAWYSPTVAPSGRIYVGSGHPENKLYAINPADGSVIWTFPASGSLSGAVTTKPAVSSDGSAVYFGSQDGFVYAINSSGTELWRFNTGQPVNSSPALSTTGNYIYFGSMLGIFYALRADTGAIFWNTSVGSAFQSSPAIGPDGTVYVGNDNGRLYAFIAGSGDVRWRFTTGEGVQSSPAVSNDGTVVYVGSYDDILYAVYTATGIEKWRFTNAKNDIQGPIAVDANDHIYFGSNDNNVYAVYYDGSEKWHFLTGGDVRGKPAVKGDGSVYVGSYDFKLYAINQFANPKSFKDLLITANRSGSTVRVGGIPVTVDSDDDWFNSSVNSIAGNKRLWAVRMEVTRSQTKVSGTYSYNLRTWMRQCDGTKTDCSEVLGTFYADTRLNYSPSSPTPHPPMMEQTINLLESDHDDFDRFLFGFTSQTATGETQAATIQNFQLSFIRSNDPTISEDPDWP